MQRWKLEVQIHWIYDHMFRFGLFCNDRTIMEVRSCLTTLGKGFQILLNWHVQIGDPIRWEAPKATELKQASQKGPCSHVSNNEF